ncbi:hypothetical protein J2W21_003102 [Sinomonas atrocyanea]|uniref:hypothetical protein n=1 Tax=Sinomonas atrocyanea TaxID=37927 RepID=UPI002782D471|nr:hypothetical protein [Sinomonas atrocyanea]MDP9885578.1 hypothetical protein [Sinomonas atrocyanea]
MSRRRGMRILPHWLHGAHRLSRVAVVAMVALAAAGCSSSASAPSATQPASAAHSSPTSAPADQPTRVFTDDELMAIVNAVTVRPFGASDSRSFRIGATANSWPAITSTAAPAECQPFAARNPFDIARDANVAFAQGAMPAFGDSPSQAAPSAAAGGPTTTAIVIARSAGKDALAASDFNYTDDLASRCSQFTLRINQGTSASAYSLRMLPAPKVGERAFAMLQKTVPGGPGDLGGTTLRVLAGTLSISLSLSVAQDADAQPALAALARTAQKIIDQAANHPPTVSTPAPNSRTPEQLAALLRGVPGPDGSAPLVNAQLIPAPGTSSARPTEAACTYDDAAYLGALAGSSMAQAQYSGSPAKKSFITLLAVSMAGSIAQPYPFDTRARALRTCPSITEDVMGLSQTRSWSSLRPLAAVPRGDAGYAVAYEIPDGTGERHVAVGARRGTLSVEANDIRATDADVQPAAEALVALVDQVFSKAGL